MNTKARTSSQQIRNLPVHRHYHEDKVEMQGSRLGSLEKASTSKSQSRREKKLALLKDVDKLKKKLRDEENIHRALQRAFNRPLGSLPRLPPYLPLNTQELLAEIAVLEEEVVRLEEKVVTYRQILYQEAVFICSKRKLENPMDYYEQILSRTSAEEQSDTEKSPVSVARTASTSSGIVSDHSSLSLERTPSASSDIVPNQMEQSCSNLMNGKQVSDDLNSTLESHGCGKRKGNGIQLGSYRNSDNASTSMQKNSSEFKYGKLGTNEISSSIESVEDGNREIDRNRSNPNKNMNFSERKLSRVKTPVRKSSFKRQPSNKATNSPRKQPENKVLGGDSEPNKISEDILKCLISIFVRMNTTGDKKIGSDMLPYALSFIPQQVEKVAEFHDPYGKGAEFLERDVGTYKSICAVDANSIDLKRKKNALFLLHKLKLLFGKLARVNLESLTHHHKLAFWINTYNSCMMNAFLEHGIPDTPEKVVLLMREASVEVGGQVLNAITIEHFILRLPFYLKQGGKRAGKGDDLKVSTMFGLECSEPLVTFALSCGSWSSPSVRVYRASQVERELEVAKREYLQAAVGVSKSDKIVIPKLLDWYRIDFAKGVGSLLDWVCVELADEHRKAVVSCLDRKGKQEAVCELIQVVPYDFTFRYLLHP